MIEVLTLLTVARVTRLITTDTIFETPRGALVRWLSREERTVFAHKISYLVVCDWCVSVYIGAGAACAYAAWHGTMPYMAVTLALAASYVTGWLATITETGE